MSLPKYMYDYLNSIKRLTDERAIEWRGSDHNNLITKIGSVAIEIVENGRHFADADGFDVVVAGPGMHCRFSVHDIEGYVFIDDLRASAVANMHRLPDIMEAIIDLASRSQVKGVKFPAH